MNENEINKIERRIDARIGVGVKKIIGVTVALFVLLAFGISSPIMWQFGRVNTKFDEVKSLVEKNTAAIRQLSESINVKNEIEAAKQGSAIAQFNLGEMYNYGRGVPEDAAEAVKWYRKAAEQGLAEAQFNLGEMYAKGEGVSQDEVESYAWYLLAKAKGSEHAGEMISDLEKRLTAEQIEKGRARVEELQRLLDAK